MNLDQYIQFHISKYRNKMFGYPAHIKWAYWSAICHYWVGGCEGLKDDDFFLRTICELEKDLWPEARVVIFDDGKLFHLENKFFHQDFARNLFKEKNDEYKNKIKQTENARKKRW